MIHNVCFIDDGWKLQKIRSDRNYTFFSEVLGGVGEQSLRFICLRKVVVCRDVC